MGGREEEEEEGLSLKQERRTIRRLVDYSPLLSTLITRRRKGEGTLVARDVT